MKLHRTLVSAAANTLQAIFESGVYADKAVSLVLKQNSRWGARDRKFIAQAVYEIVRWWRLYHECLLELKGDAYKYSDLLAIWLIDNQISLPDWEEFKGFNTSMIERQLRVLKKTRKYRESIPDWLDVLGMQELGEHLWEKELHALNNEAKLVLRVNSLKTNKQDLTSLLLAQQIEVESISYTNTWWSGVNDTVLVLKKRFSVDKLAAFQSGLFEIQDAGSQLISTFLQVKPGMTVIDACAGAGGKTLHIAAMMGNKGRVFAMDIEDKKLKELEKRAQRAGLSIVYTTLIDESRVKALANSADRLLLDVPCSGLGVLKRNPDDKWKLSTTFIDTIKQKQQYILQTYSQMLKQGGLMVYATCSIFPGENQEQVSRFLSNNNSFQLIRDFTVYPSDGFDGFYMAAIQRG